MSFENEMLPFSSFFIISVYFAAAHENGAEVTLNEYRTLKIPTREERKHSWEIWEGKIFSQSFLNIFLPLDSDTTHLEFLPNWRIYQFSKTHKPHLL